MGVNYVCTVLAVDCPKVSSPQKDLDNAQWVFLLHGWMCVKMKKTKLTKPLFDFM